MPVTVAMSKQTHFAPADRSDLYHVRAMNTLIESTPNVKALIDGMPFVVLILNAQRQIVAANEKVCSLLGVDIKDALGKRPGELIGCIHAEEGPNGCGTDYHCKVCGAVNAILDSWQLKQRITEECRISTRSGDAFDWEVTTSPLIIDGISFICVGIRDISHQKRRSSLERTFFHDIINHLGAIAGFIRELTDDYPDSLELKEVMQLTNELLGEVQSQRDLTIAESGDLVPTIGPVNLKQMLERLGQLYQKHPTAKDRTIQILAPDKITLDTDINLIKRIVGNMIKNALEASSKHETVTVSCNCNNNNVSISVHNPGLIPQDTQLQIFKRSFSTKGGPGRGIGTYSMKLLGERYLKGHVCFESNSQEGTVFTITLPQNNRKKRVLSH